MLTVIRRRLGTALVCVATVAAAGTALAVPAAANPAGTGVVINEVYGGGGNSGATYTNDFIELYNPTDAAVDLDGWSVQYASGSSSSTQGFNRATALSGSIAADGYYLVAEAAGSRGAGDPLPEPDLTDSINLSASTGAVLLASTTVTIGTRCPVDHDAKSDSGCAAGLGVTVDLVGYGSTAGHFETAPAPGAGNSAAVARHAAGADTDDNASDFIAGAPTPQNSGAGGGTSGVAVANPGDQDATVGAAIDDITLQASGGTEPYTWSASGLPNGLALSRDGVLSGTPSTAGPDDVTVTATDSHGVSGSATFTFYVHAATVEQTIAEINASCTAAQCQQRTVRTTGVVTADYATGGFNGFYLQTGGSGSTPDHPDRTPGESDALFVYGSRSADAVEVGDSVTVTGTVQWFKGMSEIGYPTVTKLDHSLDAVVPDVIPWADLQSDSDKQAHAGELMAPQGDFTVTDNFDTNYYGSITLASGKTPLQQPTDVGPAGSEAAVAVVADNAQRKITLDDGSSWNYAVFGSHTSDPLPWLTPTNPVRVGSAVTFESPVILEFRNDEWNFQPRTQVTDNGAQVATFSNDRPANTQPADVGGDISLATFNVENYFQLTGEQYVADGLGSCTYYEDREGNRIGDQRCSGSDGSPGPRGAATAASFARQQAKIVTGINDLGASIVSLEEIGNSVKFGQDRDTALAGLVDALNAAAGSDEWAYVPSPAADALPSVTEQDVIRTALIYRPADVTPVGPSHVLADESGPGQPFSIAREPLAQQFTAAGAPASDGFLVVANHFKSKGPDADTLFDDCANGGDVADTNPAQDQGAFNCTRVHEARTLSSFASEIANQVGTDKIFLLGDFNAYTHEDPMQALYADGYTDLGSAFDPSEETYSYHGLSGSLDHVLANNAALAMVTGADVWQINAQESVAFAYSRYNYNVTKLFDPSDPFAASDHDPVVVGLNSPQPEPSWDASTVYTAGDTVSYDGETWRALWWTRGQHPGDPWGPWEEIATAPDGTAIWTPSRIFTSGDTVLYRDKTYTARWWTRNQAPGAAWGPWKPAA